MTEAEALAILLTHGEPVAREILLHLGNDRSLGALQRAAETDYAKDLFARGRSRSDVASRLIARYGFSTATAYRRIDEVEQPDERSSFSQHPPEQ